MNKQEHELKLFDYDDLEKADENEDEYIEEEGEEEEDR